MPRIRPLLILILALLQALLPIAGSANSAMSMNADCGHAQTLHPASSRDTHQLRATSAAHVMTCCAAGHCDCATASAAAALPSLQPVPFDWRSAVQSRAKLIDTLLPIYSNDLLRPPISS